jgi:hypothetical protein
VLLILPWLPEISEINVVPDGHKIYLGCLFFVNISGFLKAFYIGYF